MRNQEVLLPKKCRMLKDEELRNINGGAVHLNYGRGMLDKGVCAADAKLMVQAGMITGMSIFDVAAEMYAHAKIYYAFKPIISLGAELGSSFCQSIANGIDIDDGLDTRTFGKHYYYEYFRDIYSNQ